MLSKCANPDCLVEFDYRQGRFFRFHSNSNDGKLGREPRSDRHFWLCAACSQHYTLLYRKDYAALVSLRVPQLTEARTAA
jgi:hypothetical protein